MRKKVFSKAVLIMIVMVALLMVACGSNGDGKTVLETEDSMSDFEKVELSAEDVIAIAEEGLSAIKELNPEEMIKCTNIELLYYTGRGEEANEENMLDDITELVNEMDENYNSLGAVGQYFFMDNIALYNAEPVLEEEIAELNTLMLEDPMSMFEGLENYPYNVEKAYKVQMRYDRLEENKESYVLVVYANGQWELDVYLAIVRDVYQMLMEMK